MPNIQVNQIVLKLLVQNNAIITVTPEDLQYTIVPRIDWVYPVSLSWIRGSKSFLPSNMPWGFLGQSINVGLSPVGYSDFSSEEYPQGTLGTTGPFSLQYTPITGSLVLYKNDNILTLHTDYTITSNVITLTHPTLTTDSLVAFYETMLS